MLPAAALVSSAVLEMVNLLKRSSSTFTDFWFSDLVFAVFEDTDSMMSTDGMVTDFDGRVCGKRSGGDVLGEGYEERD